jgi:hypothetical protein
MELRLALFFVSPEPEASRRTMFSLSALTVSDGVRVFWREKKFIAAARSKEGSRRGGVRVMRPTGRDDDYFWGEEKLSADLALRVVRGAREGVGGDADC